jgi:NAD(P)-dependent dehydrogenase (short-subunit alcohol dehydrogenase family)
MFDFTDRVVVITGGETGIGRAAVEAFARSGASVVIAGFLEDKGQEVVEALSGEGLTAHFSKTDVQQESSITAFVDEVLGQHGRIDVLVNNASIFDGFAGAVETSTALWDKVVTTNLRGTFLFCREVLSRDMLARGEGFIVNVSSVGGIIGGADGTAYTASKFGVIGLTRQMASDYSSRGIIINAVCPGMIQTDMRTNSIRILGEDAPPMRGVGVDPDALKRVPALRKGAPIDIANAIMFAASPYATYMNGHSLVIDGGWTIK